jgi:hypothetical protein
MIDGESPVPIRDQSERVWTRRASTYLNRRISERVDFTHGGLVLLNAEALGWLLSGGKLDFLEEGGNSR